MKPITISLIAFLFPIIAFGNEINIERLSFQDNLNGIDTIEIKNLYGDIRLRKTKQDIINYLAVSQYSNIHRAKLVTTKKDKKITLEIIYDDFPNIDSLERVDIAVILPSNKELSIVIEKGNLSSKKIGNNITVRSENSNISLKTSNSVDLYTKNGSITLDKTPHKLRSVVKLKSNSGNIRLKFNKKQTPQISIISGGITTTNSISLLTHKTKKRRNTIYQPKNIYGVASIQTDTGDIQLIEKEQL